MERRSKSVDRFAFERGLLTQGVTRIAGVDEVGRGPLAGPVIAAAVILPEPWITEGMPGELEDLNDSKQLSAAQRERFFGILTTTPCVRIGLGRVEPGRIDSINILKATHEAMNLALAALLRANAPNALPPGHVLVDGLRVKAITLPQTAIVKGDSKSYSIAAASVIAKVTRDRFMDECDARFPGYGFAAHKGYGTPAHLDAIRRLGPCPIHRRSFAPMRPVEQDLFPSGP
jgi:ribonuclease HII